MIELDHFKPQHELLDRAWLDECEVRRLGRTLTAMRGNAHLNAGRPVLALLHPDTDETLERYIKMDTGLWAPDPAFAWPLIPVFGPAV